MEKSPNLGLRKGAGIGDNTDMLEWVHLGGGVLAWPIAKTYTTNGIRTVYICVMMTENIYNRKFAPSVMKLDANSSC